MAETKASRKLILTLIALGLCFLGYVLIAIIPIVGPFYATFVGAIMGIVGLSLTGHTVAQYVQAKQETDMHSATVNAPIVEIGASEVNPADVSK